MRQSPLISLHPTPLAVAIAPDRADLAPIVTLVVTLATEPLIRLASTLAFRPQTLLSQSKEIIEKPRETGAETVTYRW